MENMGPVYERCFEKVKITTRFYTKSESLEKRHQENPVQPMLESKRKYSDGDDDDDDDESLFENKLQSCVSLPQLLIASESHRHIISSRIY